MRFFYTLSSALLIAFVLSIPQMGSAQFNPVELLSDSNIGGDADGASSQPNIAFSATGRYAVFSSAAENLVLGDDNGLDDVFLIDRDAAEGSKLTLISIDRNDTDSDGASGRASVSADGRYVVYESDATDLVLNDENGSTDIFLRDTVSGTTTRISVDTNGLDSDGTSSDPQISSDGSFVVFVSSATDLVLNDDNGVADIFRYDRVNETIDRISVDSDELEVDGASSSPSVNSDGTLVAFSSAATNLVADDTNALGDIFLRNVTAGTTTILSNDTDSSPSNGVSSNPFISDDGTLVSFESPATDLVANDDNEKTDIFLYTVATDMTVRASGDGDGDSANSAISADGAFVAFQSDSTDLVLNDNNDVTDIFAYNIATEAITRLSVTNIGEELAASSTNPAINSNGQFVVFSSSDEDLVPNDDNEIADIFSVNTQCLLTPAGVTPQDQDSDSTDDCSDACPTDANKIAAGSCGCGTADTDTDSDGTADCIDECSTDSSKTDAGDCGCGVADTDANGNGVSDCREFTAGTRPKKQSAFYRSKKDSIRVLIPLDPPGFRYLIKVLQNGKVIRSKKTTKGNVRISVKGVNGVVKVKYKELTTPTKFSKSKSVKIP